MTAFDKLRAFGQTLVAPRRPEPSYPVLPAADEQGQSSVGGVYLVGEVAGTPLIKLGLNAGHDMVDRLADAVRSESSGQIEATDSADSDLGDGVVDDGVVYDFVIIGAGASGLGAAAHARELGLKAVVIEANHVAETVYTMMKGKLLLAEPETVPLKSSMWFEECTKEELLEKWNAQIAEQGLDIREFEKVTDIRRSGDVLEVESQKGMYKGRRVILAAGKAGNPRKAGVDGEVENAARIAHRLLDPDEHQGQRILIYGGGDVALEGALALADHNEVTLVTIDEEFVYPKKRNVDKLQAAAAEGKLKIHMNSFLKEVGTDSVAFSNGGPDGERQSIGNDFVYEMIGAELPTPFFKKVGIKLEGEWNRARWVTLFGLFAFVYSLYSLKKFGVYRAGDGQLQGHKIAAWPFDRLIAPESYDSVVRPLFEWTYAPFTWLFSDQAMADMLTDRGFQQGYLYSLLYTVIMAFFGYEALIRWRGIARRKTYQTWRYASLIGFQLAFFLIVNVVAVQALTVKFAWRAWGLYQPYPLFFNTFFWWYDGDPAWIMHSFIGAGLVGTLVAIPIASRNHGKRFCTWVCGCGGLAETLGDRWRHLAAKGKRSRSWEFQGVVIFLASVLIGLVVVGLYQSDGNNAWWRVYDYLVDFWLVAVIPIALYPFFGGKVWCRYWCPLAAYNGLLSKWYGRLKIWSNDKCISCTQCSKYCQVGVDVMAFAKNQEPFDNRNSACIQCGICIDVCPMAVLSFATQEETAAPAA
ncbi:MAG TPA: NAD(P)-binding domain-containing protein [Candidatus Latescibacteria bacterium]|jgi:thioredoxin reductase/ferredoxin|nr:NAD(P)-binding domain-containing protein [Candidatus Latescibacterota bacterium]HJP33831.1 NAD(P)-binding domain-containing protein [Candidatus Latescibacterota bacterium]